MEKLIITTALTGAVTVPAQSPHLPLTPTEIANDALACAAAGAAAVHIHGRNPQDARPDSDPELFREIAGKIKDGSDLIVNITTGGGMTMTPQERLRPIPLLRPEVASFNLGSMNFSVHKVAERLRDEEWRFDWEKAFLEDSIDNIFPNTFGSMTVFAKTMAECGTVPEFEAYDLGHLHNLKFLEREGLAQPPYWIQFVLGVLGGLGASARSLVNMVDTANDLFGKDNYQWSVIGVGRHVFSMAVLAIAMGGHVRVGLEDNVYLSRHVLATNAQLVEKAARLAGELGRPIASPNEARQMLGLKGLDQVRF